jgi:hypothetical protein
MKKQYERPELTVYGTVEQLTQLYGNSSASDALIWGNVAFDPPGFNFGSRDIVISK